MSVGAYGTNVPETPTSDRCEPGPYDRPHRHRLDVVDLEAPTAERVDTERNEYECGRDRDVAARLRLAQTAQVGCATAIARQLEFFDAVDFPLGS